MMQPENPLDNTRFRDLSITTPDAADESGEWVMPPRPPGVERARPRLAEPNGHQSTANGRTSPPPDLAALASVIGQPMKRRRLVPVVLSLVGLVAVLGCLGIVAVLTFNAISLQSALDSPQAALNDFYTALHNQDYHSAYQHLSSRYQQALDEPTFQAKYASLDALDGPIQSDQISNVQTQSDSATATIQVIRGTSANAQISQVHRVQLIRENGAWKLDRFDGKQV